MAVAYQSTPQQRSFQNEFLDICQKSLKCGHVCRGVRDENTCPPCLYLCDNKSRSDISIQRADDTCVICFTDPLAAAPVIQMDCGHFFHFQCVKTMLQKRWCGPRISFTFTECPICKKPLEHEMLDDILKPIKELYTDVHRKALTRLEYEGLRRAPELSPGGRFYGNPGGFAMQKYAYYLCSKCNKAYYGGDARCQDMVVTQDEYNPAELVCGSCSITDKGRSCTKHGNDYLVYKCRYCCSVGVWYCFGTTHFCNICHTNHGNVCGMPKDKLPKCPAGPNGQQLCGDECPLQVKHPPTGEEFVIGCGICENINSF